MVDSTSVFEATAPHRPAVGDILNGQKDNAVGTVPANFIAGEEFNQLAALVAAIGTVCPLGVASVDYTTGTPHIVSSRTVRSDVLSADLTCTDNGVGDTTITWAAGKFPTGGPLPVVTLNAAVGTSRSPTATAVTNGVRVKTTDGSGVAADLGFTVQWF